MDNFICCRCGFTFHNTHKLTTGEVDKLTIKVNETKLHNEITNSNGYCPICLCVNINRI